MASNAGGRRVGNTDTGSGVRRHEPEALLAHADKAACLDFLSRMARRRSYSQTPGEQELAALMAEQVRALRMEAELMLAEGEDRVSVAS